MKKVLTVLLMFLGLSLNSQIIEVSIHVWSNYSHPQSMTLHTAIELDSLTTIKTVKGNTTYTFNFFENEIVMVDYKNITKKFKIIKTYPTKSVLNVDAQIEDRFYNFVVSENESDKTSLIIQKFKPENGKSVGIFSNDATVTFKEKHK